MNARVVRAALADVARGVARKANAIGRSEGVDMDATVSEGVRPKGRPYSRVSSDQADQEFGTAKTPRRRILARAAGGAGGAVGVETGGSAAMRGGIRP